MVAITNTYLFSEAGDPTFRVWVGITDRPANLYWEGESLLKALWKMFEAKSKFKRLVRLEWV